MKMYKEIMKAQHNELNKRVNSNDFKFSMNEEKLIKENPKVVHLDGIHTKETTTIMGEKI